MNRIITDEMVKKLIETYKCNEEDLCELERIIDEDGITEDGISDITDTFEQGYNNALEYVFYILGIKDYK